MRHALRSLLLAWLLAWSATALAQSGDAFGDGSLLPPTSPRFADPAWYDLVSVELLDTDPISVVLTLGAVDGSGGTALGLTQPIVEVYLAEAEGGAEALLPGSGLVMPLGTGWRYALRLTGDGAWGWRSDALGVVDLDAPVPLDARVSGREVTVVTPFARPEGPLDVYAVSGVYDPFSVTGWRALTRTPSPWAFSSETQRFPVVDVVPGDASARADALARGELPRAARPGGVYGAGAEPWLAAMAFGVLLALAGLIVRARAARTARAAARPTPVAAGAATDDGSDAAGGADDGAALGAEAQVALGVDSDAVAIDLIADAEVERLAPLAPAPSQAETPATGRPAHGAADDGSGPADQSAAGRATPTDAVDACEASDDSSDTEAPSDARRDPSAS